MAILFCHRPNFIFEALQLAHPEWNDLPVAMLDDDGMVRACSTQAAESGVQVEQRARLARTRCPDVRLVRLDAVRLAEVHDAFADVLRATGLPIEITGPGNAYCDLRAVAHSPRDAQPVCADLGRQLRRALGEALTPALGCDHGKFTARAAAHVTRPGHLRVVDEINEATFLAPLPTSLLPLPAPALRQLHWLGIATLADFARLPQSAVVQRWGEAGRIAQQLAKGRDLRPVQAPAAALPAPVRTDFNSPCDDAAHAAAAVRRSLAPILAALSADLRGCRALRLQLEFLDRSTQTREIAFATPVHSAAIAHAAVLRTLHEAPWHAPLVAITAAVVAAAELPTGQLTLFDAAANAPDGVDESTPFDDAALLLRRRYPDAFVHAHSRDATHPVDVRIDDSGLPVAVTLHGRVHAVECIDEAWRVDAAWWEDAGEASHRCVRLITRSGFLCELRQDLHTRDWTLTRIHD